LFSPVITGYIELLLLLQYIYSLNLRPEEILTAPWVKIIGFSLAASSAQAVLLIGIKACFRPVLCFFLFYSYVYVCIDLQFTTNEAVIAIKNQINKIYLPTNKIAHSQGTLTHLANKFVKNL
jgi:hypothetical protein